MLGYILRYTRLLRQLARDNETVINHKSPDMRSPQAVKKVYKAELRDFEKIADDPKYKQSQI